MSQATWGLVIAALSLTSYLLGKFRTLSAVGIFAAILMIGLSGRVISWAARAEAWVIGLLGNFAGVALGVSAGAVTAAVVAVLLFKMIHDWLPRNSAKKSTFWVSAAVAVLIVAGLTPFAALNNLPATVQTGVTTVTGG